MSSELQTVSHVPVALRAIEARHPVTEWKVGGLHVWPIVRTHLTAEMILSGRPKEPRHRLLRVRARPLLVYTVDHRLRPLSDSARTR